MRRGRRVSTDLVLVVLALAAVALLATLAHALEPPRVTLGGAAGREGARVEVEARVLDVRETNRARWLELTDGAHRLEAFAPPAPHVERGDTVRAQGVVSRGERAMVLSIDALEVVLATARVVRSPAELAATPWAFDGARVVVEGEVRAGMLVGDGARVGLRGDDVPGAGAVVVSGDFRYREADASFVVWVESWTPRS